jgi:hypothetical protein
MASRRSALLSARLAFAGKCDLRVGDLAATSRLPAGRFFGFPPLNVARLLAITVTSRWSRSSFFLVF